MGTSKYVYDIATGVFKRGGFFDISFDPVTEGLVEFPDADPHPNLRLDRFDVTLGKRPATPEELVEYDTTTFNTAVQGAVSNNPILAAGLLTLETRRIGRELTPEEQQGLLGEVAMRYQALRGSQG